MNSREKNVTAMSHFVATKISWEITQLDMKRGQFHKNRRSRRGIEVLAMAASTQLPSWSTGSCTARESKGTPSRLVCGSRKA